MKHDIHYNKHVCKIYGIKAANFCTDMVIVIEELSLGIILYLKSLRAIKKDQLYFCAKGSRFLSILKLDKVMEIILSAPSNLPLQSFAK